MCVYMCVYVLCIYMCMCVCVYKKSRYLYSCREKPEKEMRLTLVSEFPKIIRMAVEQLGISVILFREDGFSVFPPAS